MKRFFVFIISTLYIFSVLTLSVAATSGQAAPAVDSKAVYAGIIVLLCATVGIIIYVISTYFKK